MSKNLNKLLNRYNNLPLAIKASVWYVFCNVINKGMAFITTPIFTRIMTTEEYGQVTLYNSWYSILIVIVTLNLFYGVFNNGMTKYSDRRKEFTSSVLGLTTTLTILWFIIYLIFHDFFNRLFGLSTLLMLVMFFQFIFYSAYEFWSADKRYDYNYKPLVIVSILITLISAIIGVVAVKLSTYKVIAKIISFAIVNACFGLVLYIIVMRRGKKFFSSFFWKYCLKFNLPLIPHYLSSSILNQVDRIMIANMAGVNYAAIYSIAYSIAMLLNIVVSAIINAITPYIYKSLKNNNYAGIKKMSSSLSIIMALLCCVITLFAPEIVMIMGSHEYYQAIYIIPPVAASLFFIFLYPLFSNVEFYFEKNKFIMIASTLSAFANILLNYIFIKLFGYIAAGYTTLVCYIIYAFSHYLFCKKILKEHNIDNIYNEKMIGFIGILVCILCILCTLVYKYILIRYFIILIIIIGIFLFKNELISLFCDENLKKD